METPTLPGDSLPENVDKDQISALEKQLDERAKRAQLRATFFLALTMLVLITGVMGIILAPELILRDREKLQPETI